MSDWYLMSTEEIEWIKMLLPTLANEISKRPIHSGEVCP